jgi:hypothetical protein
MTVFRFTHTDVYPDDRLRFKLRGTALRDYWEVLHRNLRKAAEEELEVFERKGPDLSKLVLSCYERWEAYDVREGRRTILTQAERKALTREILDVVAAREGDLDASAPARWLVDLYSSEDSGGPVGQCWVSDDGTFGFGWLPDLAWGKSARLTKMLSEAKGRLAPKPEDTK